MIVLGVIRELELPEDIINVEGGAIVHDHLIGATSAILTMWLPHAMHRTHKPPVTSGEGEGSMMYVNLAFLVSAMVFAAMIAALNIAVINVATVARSTRSERNPS